MFTVKTEFGYAGEDVYFEGMLAYSDEPIILDKRSLKFIENLLISENIPYEVLTLQNQVDIM